MALIVRKTDSAANKHQTLICVDESLPSPFKHLILSHGTVSWGERILIALQQRFPTERFSFTGKNLFVCDFAVTKFIHDTNETAVLMMQINDDESLGDVSVQQGMQEHLNSIVENRSKFLTPFGVNTGVELDQKIRWLRTLKGQALKIYFSKEGFGMRRKIDNAIVKVTSKALSLLEQDRLDQYWASSRRSQLCPHHHSKLENELYQLFATHLSEAVKKVNKRRQFSIKSTYGARLRRALSGATENVREALLGKGCTLYSKDTTLEWNYQVLKCDLLAEPLIDYVLCKLLRPLIAKTPTEIIKIAKRKERESVEEIAVCESELQSANCCIDPEIIQNKLGTPPLASEMIEAIVLVNRRSKELQEQRLSELKAQTSETFLRDARAEWGYDEHEMRKALPKKGSPHDRIVQAMMLVLNLKKDPHIQDEQNSFDPDLSLNLDQMNNAVQYFEQQYRERDAQALALLQPRAEELES